MLNEYHKTSTTHSVALSLALSRSRFLSHSANECYECKYSWTLNKYSYIQYSSIFVDKLEAFERTSIWENEKPSSFSALLEKQGYSWVPEQIYWIKCICKRTAGGIVIMNGILHLLNRSFIKLFWFRNLSDRFMKSKKFPQLLIIGIQNKVIFYSFQVHSQIEIHIWKYI